MPVKKYDPDILGAEYAMARRVAGGMLTKDAFFKAKGIPVNYGCRRYGKVLDNYWARSIARAADEFTKRNGINMARELGDIFTKHKELMGRAFAKIIPKEGDGMQPVDLEEALAMLKEGSVGMRDVVKILSGGMPVQPPRAVEPVFRWNEPITPSSTKKASKHRAR